MADVPPGMLTEKKPTDPDFDDGEELYRRFAPENLDGDEVSIAAVELPDMSVMREKYGKPRWLLLSDDVAGWGVLVFLVRDIPPDRIVWHKGVLPYTLQPRHVPHRYNYPHSEVWVFLRDQHICKESDNLDLLDPDFHLRWRELIVLASQVRIYPGEAEPE